MKLNTKKTEGVTEKIMEEELLRARLVGRSEGRYDGVAEYKQKLIKRLEKIKPIGENYNRKVIYLDEVEAVIREES
jgi:hypothetical protein